MNSLDRPTHSHRRMFFAALLGTFLAGPALAAGVTIGGNNAVYASLPGLTFPQNQYAKMATATIPKGKRHYVVDISLMAISPLCDHGAVGLFAGVNGMPVEPYSSALVPSDPQFLNCAATGEWWLDLDAAEAANPGKFIGQPIDVEAWVGSPTATPNGVVVIKARLVKK